MPMTRPDKPARDGGSGLMLRFAALSLGLAGAATSLSGCAPGMASAAGLSAASSLVEQQASSFLNGTLRAARFVSLPQGHAEVIAALDELQVEIKRQRLDDHSAYVLGKARGGREIKVE